MNGKKRKILLYNSRNMKRKTKEDEERKTQHAQLLGKELKQTVRV